MYQGWPSLLDQVQSTNHFGTKAQILESGLSL